MEKNRNNTPKPQNGGEDKKKSQLLVTFIITVAIVLVVSSIRNKRGSGLPAALGLNYFREDR